MIKNLAKLTKFVNDENWEQAHDLWKDISTQDEDLAFQAALVLYPLLMVKEDKSYVAWLKDKIRELKSGRKNVQSHTDKKLLEQVRKLLVSHKPPPPPHKYRF